MTLQTSIRDIEADTAVVTFAGSLTLGVALKTADAQIQSLIEKGVSRMVLDLTAVPYVDSSAGSAGAYLRADAAAQRNAAPVRRHRAGCRSAQDDEDGLIFSRGRRCHREPRPDGLLCSLTLALERNFHLEFRPPIGWAVSVPRWSLPFR